MSILNKYIDSKSLSLGYKNFISLEKMFYFIIENDNDFSILLHTHGCRLHSLANNLKTQIHQDDVEFNELTLTSEAKILSEFYDTNNKNLRKLLGLLVFGKSPFESEEFRSLADLLVSNGLVFEELPTDKSVIDELCINLNALALDGKIDDVIGRDDELLRVSEVLGKKKKNNPVLIGKAGVGKTCIAEGLALNIVRGEVPDILKNAVVYSLELGAMVAGTSFRGQFEEKVIALLKEFERIESTGVLPILFIDEIHGVIGAGSAQGSLDLANIIKPALAKGKLRCIGATTPQEWTKFINQDKALKRRFTNIDVEEPTRDQTIEILTRAIGIYEKKHSIKYTQEAIESAVDLSMEYMKDSALPDKALDLIDLTGSIHRIKLFTEVSREEVKYSLHRKTGISLDALNKDEKKDIVDTEPLTDKIKSKLFGQDSIVDSVCQTIEFSKAGLNDTTKPIGSFLFTGPTGTGKTELAKLIAKNLNYHFERIDMSEFMEQHSVSKLIGAPAGYVGYDAGGRLTKIIEKNPMTVLLLDEMEKAHHRIQDILLQAMDNARITDSQGEEIDFKNVIIIMTSNGGAREAAKSSIGFSGKDSVSTDKQKIALESYFSPEFRARLNGVYCFKGLSSENLISVLDKYIVKFNEDKLTSKGLKLECTEGFKTFILDKVKHLNLGARPIEAEFRNIVYPIISKSILYGELKTDKKVCLIDYVDRDVSVSYK